MRYRILVVLIGLSSAYSLAWTLSGFLVRNGLWPEAWLAQALWSIGAQSSLLHTAIFYLGTALTALAFVLCLLKHRWTLIVFAIAISLNVTDWVLLAGLPVYEVSFPPIFGVLDLIYLVMQFVALGLLIIDRAHFRTS